MQLIYRGETIEVPSYSSPVYQKPRALNWRYQAPGETYGEPEMAAVGRAPRVPRAINWRWQPL